METKRTKPQYWILIVLTVMLAIMPSLGFAAEVWIPMADMPTPRAHPTCSVVDGKIYAIGGRSATVVLSQNGRTVEAYDPATNQWTTKASMPTGRTQFAASAVDGKIYAIGGLPFGPAIAVVEAYDPATDTWTRKADAPTRQWILGSAVVEGRIYLIGGNARSAVEIYDPSEDSWTRGADMPTPRGPQLSVVDGKIYAIGGLAPGPTWGPLAVVEAYDPATDTWTQKTDMPTPRYFFATAALDGKIYAIGGSDVNDDMLESVEVYDPATDRWTEGPSLMIAKQKLCAAVVDGAIFAMGGSDWRAPAVIFGTVEAFGLGHRAREAQPADGTTDVFYRPALQWTPGTNAAQHDVYFGTQFDDVNDAGNADAAGPDSVYQGRQDGNSYAVPGTLDFDQTYYWRIDEVNGPPDYAVFKGNVWSFTTGPIAYPITNITATASSSFSVSEPDNTVNGSGLVDDLHGTSIADMWISAGIPATIEYAFDRAYTLHELWIWNANQTLETFVGFGAKDVVIEHSLDGENWTVLESVAPLAQAPGREGYAHNNTIDFGGAVVRQVRLTVNSVHGISPQASLSEVRFYSIPTHASHPMPPDGTTTKDLDVTLQWRPGRQSLSHEVLLSSDPTAVQDGSAVIATVKENRLTPDPLIYGTTYTWQVNEVNEGDTPAIHLGDLWNFTTPQYEVIEHFNQYNDACERIYFTWLDGAGHSGAAACGIEPFAGNGTGSVVGNLEAPFAENRIVRSGRALSVTYDNSMSPFYCEVESAAFALPSDWTLGAAQTLSLQFRGHPVGFRENTDATITSITMSGIGEDIAFQTDEGQFAYRELTGDGSITVRLDSLQDVTEFTAAGVMIRETLDPWSKYVFLVGGARDWMFFQYRSVPGENTIGIGSEENSPFLPVWLRLTRSGDTVTAQRSRDGVVWENIANNERGSRTTIPMSDPVYVGLAVTSGDNGTATVADFSRVSFSGQVSDRWQTEALTVEQHANDPESLYLGIADDRGGVAVIRHPDPAATQTATWTEWRIPMSDFAAVDLSRVQKVFLGVGDRDNPASGGKGKIYLEDIRIGRPHLPAEDLDAMQ